MSTATKERPILFSGEMVRSILAGNKTQTRRIIKSRYDVEVCDEGGVEWPGFMNDLGDWELMRCPYGKPGDRLWVREKWRCIHWPGEGHEEGATVIQYYDGTKQVAAVPNIDEAENLIEKLAWQGAADIEKAGYEFDDLGQFTEESENNYTYDDPPIRWRPSIHMPRWASRITLEVTGVRVERLQEISEADAKAEGVSECVTLPGDDGSFVMPFRNLWESINGPKSWDANPWVWVVEFRRVK